MKVVDKGYFLLIDPQKNTLLIPTNDELLDDVFQDREIRRDIKRHKTKKELENELSTYLKTGGKYNE